ncbi:LTA synthase family protein, partial [Methyloversatilis discipulorum]|uniref:LTA synthase family protein n=1 Tax=Methyloversatilis discipulorum TaxID=1119528 RepID=UPI003137FD7A
LRFANVYATGTRTVRGLEALSLGTPPVPGQAIVRRTNNNNLSTVGEILAPQGVVPMFIYGGYGYFDNMNSYFRGNDYLIVDRTDFPKDSIVFENVWGVADESLYANALIAMNRKAAEGKPFFAQIMTTSNHRPYTYPDGRIDIPSPGGRHGAVKYTDWAIGQFIREAKKQPWFADTLFVFVADHCASVAGRTRLPVAKYRIPLIFYAPDMLPPGEFTDRLSQIDLAPTLLEVMGKNGDDHFFGRAFFEEHVQLDRVFISNYQDLGYLRGDLLTVLSPQRMVRAYRVDPATLESTPTEPDPQRVKEAIAYYQTAAAAFKQGRLQMPAAQ